MLDSLKTLATTPIVSKLVDTVGTPAGVVTISDAVATGSHGVSVIAAAVVVIPKVVDIIKTLVGLFKKKNKK